MLSLSIDTQLVALCNHFLTTQPVFQSIVFSLDFLNNLQPLGGVIEGRVLVNLSLTDT